MTTTVTRTAATESRRLRNLWVAGRRAVGLPAPRSFSKSAITGGREGREREVVVPEAVFLAAVDHVLLAQRLAPFVLEEDTRAGARLGFEVDAGLGILLVGLRARQFT